MKKANTMTAILAAALLAYLCSFSTARTAPTTISVNPPSQTPVLGDSVVIDIDIDFAENLSGYEVWLSFNSTILNATIIEYRGYLNEPTFIACRQVNNTGGYVALSVLSTNTTSSKTGSSPPPLATINFTVTGVGVSQLHLYNTKLADYQAKPILHETSDGQVSAVIPEFSPSLFLLTFGVLTMAILITAVKSKPKHSLNKSL